jgi:hypothetical protein
MRLPKHLTMGAAVEVLEQHREEEEAKAWAAAGH